MEYEEAGSSQRKFIICINVAKEYYAKRVSTLTVVITGERKKVPGSYEKHFIHNLLTSKYPQYSSWLTFISEKAGLGCSVGCAVRLETRRSRVQPQLRSATFFRGD